MGWVLWRAGKVLEPEWPWCTQAHVFLLCPAQKYKDAESSLKIEEVDGLELVKKFSEDMETMLRRKVEAVKVPLPISSTGLLGPPSDPTDCRWTSPGWVECRLCYTNQVTTGVRVGISQPGFVDIQE